MTQFRSSVFSSARTARRRRGGVLRWLRWAAVAVVALTVLGLLGVTALWRYADSRITRTEIPALEQPVEDLAAPDGVGADEPAAWPDALNVLVVGLDTREGLTDEQLEALGTTDHDGQLTDTVMLVQVSPTRDKAVLLSFPRDLKVEVPGHGASKINAVHALGGPNLLVEVVEDYTGLQLDHYVEVSIAGFLDIVDAVGGVEICLEQPMVDVAAGVDLPAGCQLLDGTQATGFVRSRNVEDEFGELGDFGRIARQQYFVKQAMRRATARGILLNPFRLRGLIDAVAASVTTDDGLGARQMLALADALKDLSADAVETRAIPGYWSRETGFVHAYPEETELLLQSLRTGGSLPAIGVDAPDELRPADVRVMVLNGEGTEGLAGRAAALVDDQGFVVAGTDNADSFDVEVSRVEVVAGDEPLAALVAAAFPGVEVVVVDRLAFANADVVLVVGADRLGLDEPTA